MTLEQSSFPAIQRLRAAAPGYAAWAATEPGALEDQDLVYMQAANIAHYLVAMALRGDTQELAGIFEGAEELLASGDDTVVNLVIVGFLEAVQNVAGHRRLSYEALIPHLGPRSYKAWQDLNAFWDEVILEDHPARLSLARFRRRLARPFVDWRYRRRQGGQKL